MLAFRSFRTRLQAAFVLLGVGALAIAAWEASTGAANALRDATHDRLTAIAETRRRQVERYFEDLSNHALALSSDESTIAALEEFRAAWSGIPPSPPESDAAEALRALYERALKEEWRRWYPGDPRTLTLQQAFLIRNPHPPDARDLLLSAVGTGAYNPVHVRYHPTLHRYKSAFGFYDVFLLDREEGRILYTVIKEIDFGTRLTQAPYSGTSLARAYRRALELEQPETYVVEDYQPYAASAFAPAAFFAAPVWRRGVKTGVLAIQVSVAELNRVMTGDRKWREEGLGATGQSYIVGPDRTLRSDFRTEIEQPAEFFRQLEQARIAPGVIARIRTNRTAILSLPAGDEVSALIRSGERGAHSGRDLRGIEVLRSVTPLRIAGLEWFLVAEIEAEEALAAARDIRRKILVWGLVIAAAFFLAAGLLARSVARPLLALTEGAARLGRRDFTARIAVESPDEIGELAGAFNRMADDLQRTTVSKEELEALAGRLISAQEEERMRIARELHDDLTQRLAAVAIELGKIERDAAAAPVRSALAKLKQEMARLSSDIHGLSRRLHPSTLDDLGLTAAIESECRGFFERGGTPVDLQTEGAVDDVPREVRLTVYRIVQEALRNIWRHADADEVAIRLRRVTAAIELEIRDNGRGFERSEARRSPGLGLASMEERARLVGGSCAVESKPGGGTRIAVHLPLRSSDEQTESTARG